MSVEFRQRTPGEYAKIAWKRKWMIILPAIAIAVSVAWVVWQLPDLYESSTLIVVKPSTLPNSVVPTITEDSLTRQINSIAQVVTSRSSLEPLIEKYELYKAERQRGEPMEVLVDYMRVNIKVEVNTSRNDITNGFNITYRGRNAKTTQAVTAELASKYIDEQTKNTINSTSSAKQFIDQQVNQTKEELDVVDKQRLDFMQQNVGNLPSEAASLVGQLTGLREQQKAYISEVGRLQDRRSALTSQLAVVKKSSDQMKDDIAENTTDPKTTLAWSQLVSRKADLESQLTRMLTELRPKHPDVLAKQAEVDSVKEAMDQMIMEWKQRIKEKQDKLRDRPDLTVANLEAELGMIDGETKREQSLLGEIDSQINQVMDRINHVPGAEVALGALDRDYQTRKSQYDALLMQQQKIGLGADAASQQQGEGIQVIDPANLPARPVAPKRLMLMGAGLGAGLAFGLFLVGLFEVPRLLTVQTSEDAAHYTGLPVLVAVPELLTAQEAQIIPRRRRLILAAAIAAMVLAIPALALVLKLTQVFERFAV
ncbi:MAG: protein tyrosine kinase modulator [Pyrinomonadaceae bacterium]|jgi:polysaccharide chain length determinant protein (PEP-CTERM system associated)|nr:protein tyrosine kinase modulator [Pyrinomonadaceae bacterium]